jgi:hypothetical protein
VPAAAERRRKSPPGLRWDAGNADAVPWPAEACRLAHDAARSAVARRWGVPAAECRLTADRLLHQPSGRALRYRLWLEVA